ncbi:MAG: hypothetical protein IT327_21570 [Anaerolineae bacterium]|nr:hypothetical protein [Anaerolineae bacterium]
MGCLIDGWRYGRWQDVLAQSLIPELPHSGLNPTRRWSIVTMPGAV